MCYAPFLLVLSVRIRDTPCFNFLGFFFLKCNGLSLARQSIPLWDVHLQGIWGPGFQVWGRRVLDQRVQSFGGLREQCPEGFGA